jgi:hypothetical protein
MQLMMFIFLLITPVVMCIILLLLIHLRLLSPKKLDLMERRALRFFIKKKITLHPVRLAYQPPGSSTFLSEQTSHFSLRGNQPPTKRACCYLGLENRRTKLWLRQQGFFLKKSNSINPLQRGIEPKSTGCDHILASLTK